jgi:hypothetical protein
MKASRMIDIKEMLYRQAQWQRSLARLSWEEKLRLAETLHRAAQLMEQARTRRAEAQSRRRDEGFSEK